MFQILLCIHIISFSYKKRNLYVLRLMCSTLISIGFLFCIPDFKFDLKITEYIYETLFYVFLSFISYLNIRFCYQESKKEAYFAFVSGYTVQHIGYIIFSMIDIIFLSNSSLNSSLYFQYVFLRRLSFTPIFILLSIYPYLLVKRGKGVELANKSLLLVLTFSLFANVSLSLGITKEFDILTYEMMKLMNLLCCLLILFVLFYLRKKMSMQKEIIQLNLIQEEQAKLYKMNLNNRNVMNIKAHDLKHQLLRINSLDENTKNEIEKTISLYDSEFLFNREALNIVLQEKNIICKRHKIELNALIEEECLKFLNDTDLYSLFGNILDNAIEACLKIENKKERLIILRIKNAHGVTIIKEINTFFGNLKFDNKGNVVTSKSNNEFHGYGLKSIKMIVEKYNGKIDISTSNSNFTICLSF